MTAKQENSQKLLVPLASQVIMKRDLAAVLLRSRRAAPGGNLSPLQLERYSQSLLAFVLLDLFDNSFRGSYLVKSLHFLF